MSRHRRRSVSTDARRRILAVILAAVSVSLVAIPVVNYVRERNEVASLAAPVPPSVMSTTTSSSPTAPATTDTLPQATTSSRASVSKTATPPVCAVPFVPTQVYIPAIKVNTQVQAKPTEYVFDKWLKRYVDRFAAPDGMKTVAWWSDGPKACEKSELLTVLGGHTQINGYGVFNNLGSLARGQQMILAADKGKKSACYEVIKVVDGIPKDKLGALKKVLENAPKGAVAVAITCSGDVNGALRSRKENTAVFFRQIPCQGK